MYLIMYFILFSLLEQKMLDGYWYNVNFNSFHLLQEFYQRKDAKNVNYQVMLML